MIPEKWVVTKALHHLFPSLYTTRSCRTWEQVKRALVHPLERSSAGWRNLGVYIKRQIERPK